MIDAAVGVLWLWAWRSVCVIFHSLALSEEPAPRSAAHLFKCLIIFKLCEDWRA